MKKAFAIVIFLLAATVCVAQNVKKIPLAVGHQGEDSEGQIMAFKLKEAIRSSRKFVLVDDNSSMPRIAVRMVSSKATVDNRLVGNTLSYAIVYDSREMPANGAFLSVSGITCNPSELEICVDLIMATVDRWTDNLQRQWPNLWKTL